MAADHGLAIGLSALVSAAGAKAIVSAMPFGIDLATYGWVSVFALTGIVMRHCSAAAEKGAFDLKALVFDIPTAPLLGLAAYTGAIYFGVEPYAIPFLIGLLGFLGPAALRQIWAVLLDVMRARLTPPPSREPFDGDEIGGRE